MNFHYDLDADVLTVTLSDGRPVLVQTLENRPRSWEYGDARYVESSPRVVLDAHGHITQVIISHPHQGIFVKEILTRYPMDVNQSFFLVTIAERLQLFRFPS